MNLQSRLLYSILLVCGMILPSGLWSDDAAVLAKLPPKGDGNYYFVSANDPAADDANDGSSSRPFKTVQRGADMLQPGDTLWIREGEYREFVKLKKSGESFDKMLNVRGYPGEKAIIKGSELLTGWSRTKSEPDRPIWEVSWPPRSQAAMAGWSPDPKAPYEKLCNASTGKYPSMIACDDDPLLPMFTTPAIEAMKPPKTYCQYFVGHGRGQKAMKPGTCYYDEARNKVLVWLKGDGDPNKHRMEAAVRGAWYSKGKYIRVEDLFFQYAELERPVTGGVVFVMTGPGDKGGQDGDGNIARNLDISLGAFAGAVFRGGQRVTTLVENCRIHHNGQSMGNFHGCGLPDTDSWLIVRGCELTDNNLFHWSSRWDAGGKHLGTRVLIENCTIARNRISPGVWFDIHQRDCIVNRCYLRETEKYGLYYEIGETGAFINNVVEAAPHCAGIITNGSSRCLIANNFVITPNRGIVIGAMGNAEGQGGRMNCYNRAYNNIIICKADLPAMSIIPDGPAAKDNVSDNNIYWRELPAGQTGATPWSAMQFGDGGRSLSLDGWRKERGMDLLSRVVDPLVTYNGAAVTYLPNSPALSGGKRLTLSELEKLFAVRTMPKIKDKLEAWTSIQEYQPPGRAFLEKLAELLAVPADKTMPVGPIPEKENKTP
ncbi:MAG: right-handed parallel beta-helix repeat-containing protein [Phycisphaerae bacterium]|nr:right-handed parallel beta-helix repeat-containing protein [Phycisphaerae bacterium]